MISNIDKLIIPITLTEEVMRTQFYDKVDNYDTLEYTEHAYRLDKFKEQIMIYIRYSLILKLLHLKKNTCPIFAGFITKKYNTNLLVLIIVLLIC